MTIMSFDLIPLSRRAFPALQTRLDSSKKGKMLFAVAFTFTN
jgi:hypothetical protein